MLNIYRSNVDSDVDDQIQNLVILNFITNL